MRKICIINQKGGVGKTTTTVNLSVGLARKKRKILVLDLDAQGNVSTCLGKKSEKTMYDLLVNKVPLSECLVNVEKNLDVVTADGKLAEAETILMGRPNRERILSRVLLLPVVSGVTYEIIRWMGKSKSNISHVFAYPGLMLQKLTTREPDYSQLEVAIKALKRAEGIEDESEEEGENTIE